MERTPASRDASTGHHLDLVSARLQLLAHRPAHGGGAVRDVCELRALDVTGAQVRLVGGRMGVAMAPGLAEYPPGPEHPGP